MCGKLISFDFFFISNTVKVIQQEGFHLDIEDYLMGLLQLASELVKTSISNSPFFV